MELALLLVLLVIVELALTVYMVAKHKQYLGRITKLERNVKKMAEVLRDLASEQDAVECAPADVTLSDLVGQATPEDIAQAQAVLKALNLQSQDSVEV